MHIDIAASIREVLDNMDAVSINALGTLQLRHIPAYFSDKGTTLSPPTMVLDVNDNITSNGPLIKTITNNYGISKEAAKKLVGSFNKKLLNNLVNYKKVSIEGIALITRSDKGKVKIETTSGFIDAYYNELPKVSIKPNVKVKPTTPSTRESAIPPITNVKEKKSAPIESSIITSNGSNGVNKKTATPEQKSKKQDFIYKKQDNLPSKSNVPKTELKAAAPKAKSPIVPPKSSVASNTSQPIKNIVYNEKKPSILWPLILLTAILLVLLLCFKTCSKYFYSNSNKSDKSEMTITDVDILDGVTATDSISAAALTELRKDNSIIPASGECKIITGVFSRTINVIAMKDRVREEGYAVYTESLGDYTRVGIIFNCNEETDLEAYLQEIRRTIARRAWYLDPSLYVEYIN